MPRVHDYYAEAEQAAADDNFHGRSRAEVDEAFYGPDGVDGDDDDDDSLGSWGQSFNPYEQIENEDYDDLEELRLLFRRRKQSRKIKCQHQRKDWQTHREDLIYTNEWESRFRMSPEHFDVLLEELREALTVSVRHSLSSTSGNEPIHPEVILAIGLRFCGLGEGFKSVADIYGISVASAKRVVQMFLDAVDYNDTFPPLQLVLPDPSNLDELLDLANRWNDVSTSMGLFKGFLGPLDGWLPRTEAPKDVPNQGAYYSGHYQCYGLNCQALCDPDLLFMYFCIAAPGKTNDVRAFDRCSDLKQWLAALPPEFFAGGDNAYILTRKLLTPYTKAEMKNDTYKRSYNFYFSQLRIRIEMAFGLLSTKWRILRNILNYYNRKNAQIIRVCTKLHNFCIRMKKNDGVYVTPQVRGDAESLNPIEYGVMALQWGKKANQVRRWGYCDASPVENTNVQQEVLDYEQLVPPDDSRREEIWIQCRERQQIRPEHNVARNRNLEYDDEDDSD